MANSHGVSNAATTPLVTVQQVGATGNGSVTYVGMTAESVNAVE